MSFNLHRSIRVGPSSFSIRPIENEEHIYNKHLDVTIIDNRNIPWVMQERGWVVFANGIIAGVVKGRPGNWYLCYLHEKAGLKKERINIPKTAPYRMLKIIEDNPRK